MKIYYTIINVIPIKNNPEYNNVKNVTAYCFILEDNPQDALIKIIFNIEKFDWEISDIELYPIEVTREKFIGKDIGLESFDRAQKEGLSIVYIGVSSDGKIERGPIDIKSSYNLDISEFIKIVKRYKNKGRCLHYDGSSRCNEYISAHSIQNKGLLSKIAQNGHVMGLSRDYSDLKINKGRASYKRIGVNNISTFQGFCKTHDNKIFEPIDNFPLLPTDQQIFLYAFRSLCRELFVKENALDIYRYYLKQNIKQKAIRELFTNLEKGTNNGYENLKRHKNKYDYSLKNNKYEDIKYTLFISSQEPTIAFSGLLYPDYDFIGRRLQKLEDLSSSLDLITFCSTPMKQGWAFLFAWHESSSSICNEYMRSLATAAYENGNIENFLFRLVISSENHAISPEWWANLGNDKKNMIINRISNSIDTFKDIPPTYLQEGLEGVSNWRFENVINNFLN